MSIPHMLDRLTRADRATDAWLSAHGAAWRWPRYQGGQVDPGRVPDPIDAIDPLTLLMVRAELLQVLESAQENGLNPEVLDAPEAVSTAEAAAQAHCTQRSVQGSMKERTRREREGQMTLPGMPSADEVYAADDEAKGGEK